MLPVGEWGGRVGSLMATDCRALFFRLEAAFEAAFGIGDHEYSELVSAMQRAKGADPVKVRDEIEKTKGYVGTGGIVNLSPTDHMGLDLSAFRMLEVKKGDWVISK